MVIVAELGEAIVPSPRGIVAVVVVVVVVVIVRLPPRRIRLGAEHPHGLPPNRSPSPSASLLSEQETNHASQKSKPNQQFFEIRQEERNDLCTKKVGFNRVAHRNSGIEKKKPPRKNR